MGGNEVSLFQISSPELNPHKNLLFSFYTSTGFNNGIFKFAKREDGWIEGENRFFVPGPEEQTGELSIVFRLSAGGTAWVRHVAFEECEPIPPRNVHVLLYSKPFFPDMGGLESVSQTLAEQIVAAGHALHVMQCRR